MGNNNVVAGPKDEDRTGIEDQQNPCLEEINGIDSKVNNQIVSDNEIKNFHEEIKESSSENSCVGEDLRSEKQMLDLAEDIEAQIELSEEIGESPLVHAEEIQELLETEAVKDLVEDVELLDNKDLEANENILENEENNDTDLLRDHIDEKQENGENLVHDTDSEVMETILENDEKINYDLPIDEIGAKTKDVSFGDEIENKDIEEKESQIEDNITGKVIEEPEELDQVIKITQEIETFATELTANIKEEGKLKAELPIPDPQEPDFENSFDSASLKLIDPYSENDELQTLQPNIDVPNVVETKLVTFLENETISGRVSTGSIQEKTSLNPELRKSSSFVFDLSLESKFDDSDQTPLLYNNKAICRSISSSSSQPTSVEEKTIQVERSDSVKLKSPFSNLLKEEGLDTNFLKQDCQTSSQDNALIKGSEKRKPWPSMFTACICCPTAIS